MYEAYRVLFCAVCFLLTVMEMPRGSEIPSDKERYSKSKDGMALVIFIICAVLDRASSWILCR